MEDLLFPQSIREDIVLHQKSLGLGASTNMSQGVHQEVS